MGGQLHRKLSDAIVYRERTTTHWIWGQLSLTPAPHLPYTVSSSGAAVPQSLLKELWVKIPGPVPHPADLAWARPSSPGTCVPRGICSSLPAGATELDPPQTELDIVIAMPATALYAPIYQGRNLGGWGWEMDADIPMLVSARVFNANLLKQLNFKWGVCSTVSKADCLHWRQIDRCKQFSR